MPPVLFADSALSLLSLPPHLLLILATGILFFVVAAVLAAAASVVTMWSHLRTRPPLHEVYATRADFEALERRVQHDFAERQKSSDAQFSALWNKLDAVQRSMQAGSDEVMRALGRLEGAKG